MSEQIHDTEADTDQATVRSLLVAQCPQWSHSPLTYVSTSGTTNAIWRIGLGDGANAVVRLPRTEGAASSVAQELQLLPALASTPLATFTTLPTVLHAGTATSDFPYPWAVLDWLDGDDGWTARHDLHPNTNAFAIELAEAVTTIGAIEGVPAPARTAGERGGPMRPLLAALDWWLDDPQWSAGDLLDVERVRRLAAESLEVADEPVEHRFVHGDLLPGNLLVDRGRLTAIIDWGSAGYADPAQDITAGWAVLDAATRPAFFDAVGADEATRLRARAIELEHAVAALVYYRPRGHALADVAERTLHRLTTN